MRPCSKYTLGFEDKFEIKTGRAFQSNVALLDGIINKIKTSLITCRECIGTLIY